MHAQDYGSQGCLALQGELSGSVEVPRNCGSRGEVTGLPAGTRQWKREGHTHGEVPKGRCTVALLANVEEHREGPVGVAPLPKTVFIFRGVRQAFKGS